MHKDDVPFIAFLFGLCLLVVGILFAMYPYVRRFVVWSYDIFSHGTIQEIGIYCAVVGGLIVIGFLSAVD